MKNRWIAIALAAGAAGGLVYAQQGEKPSPEQREEFQERRKEFIEKRLAKLPEAEQKLARRIEPLRDSLFRTIGQYHRKVHEGATARSLVAERTAIVSLESQIQAIQAQDRETYLDLLADLPGPGGPRGPEGHGGKWSKGAPPGSDSACSREGAHHHKHGPDAPPAP